MVAGSQCLEHHFRAAAALIFRRLISAFQPVQCLFVVEGMLSLGCSATRPSGDDQVVALLGFEL